jgi:dihydroneopterin aldolase
MTTVDYDVVLQTIRRWPVAQRFALMQELLRALAVEVSPPRTRQTLPRALGLLATNAPAPTDVQVKQWLNERRTEKYG